MKPERAIEIIKEHEKERRTGMHFDSDPWESAMALAVQALKKQIPAKPAFAGGRYGCKCGWDICRNKQPYCFMCGQKLDWGQK